MHAKGLKFGIYSDAGRKTCGGSPGSQGHEYQDAKTYAAWGVDYLKYDWCETGTRNAEEAYTLMADALRDTGRDIVFSMCEWGRPSRGYGPAPSATCGARRATSPTSGTASTTTPWA
ncbi:hypothetical protein ACRAWD_18515 [Caulobacter segnis]